MKEVSPAVVKRLPRYYRILKRLSAEGVDRVSSRTLAELMDITASQVRQDFCNFGGFGQQGYGYDVPKLIDELCEILGLNKTQNMVIIGAGNIGRALAGYVGFQKEGFYIKALFDIECTSDSIDGIPLYTMEQFGDIVRALDIDIAVIATKSQGAIEAVEVILKAGIKSIWNFAPINLDVPSDVIVENINMSESLYVLSYKSRNNIVPH